MAGITLENAQAQLTLWLAASSAVASGQSYTIGNRSLTRVNAGDIQAQIDYWNTKVQQLTGNPSGGIRIRGITPV